MNTKLTPFAATTIIASELRSRGVFVCKIKCHDNLYQEGDVIDLKDDLYLVVEPYHVDAPSMFFVSLDESMHSGGDAMILSSIVDVNSQESFNIFIGQVAKLFYCESSDETEQ